MVVPFFLMESTEGRTCIDWDSHWLNFNLELSRAGTLESNDAEELELFFLQCRTSSQSSQPWETIRLCYDSVVDCNVFPKTKWLLHSETSVHEKVFVRIVRYWPVVRWGDAERPPNQNAYFGLENGGTAPPNFKNHFQAAEGICTTPIGPGLLCESYSLVYLSLGHSLSFPRISVCTICA